MSSINLFKLGTVTILTIGTIACTSSGNYSSTASSSSVINQEATDKAAAEKAAAEKAAAENAAAEKAAAEKAAAEKAAAEKAAAEKAAAEKAAAEKAAAEKAAAEKAAAEKAAAEKAAAEKAAAEKAAAEKAAAEKAAAEKAAAEKAAAEKAAAEKAAAEKAAAEKAAAEKAAAEKAAAEKAAAEKAAAEKAAAEKAAAEKAAAENAAAIEANRQILLTKAKEAGLSEAQAASYAENNKEYDTATAQKALDTLIINIERAEIAAAKGISESNYPQGEVKTSITGNSSQASSQQITDQYGTRFVSVRETTTSGKRVYNQYYSVVLGDFSTIERTTNGQTSITNDLVLDIKGLKTKINDLPTLGTATYSGKAFTAVNTNGSLSYTVNFTDRLGKGSITGLDNTISLEQGIISGTGITSTAKQQNNIGKYSLDFYGKKAEEIAGKVSFNGKDTVGFGGIRSEISK
ncbi:Slam-dependent surface lipoprotein [uncultured Acinetobacter sp.]|uniref:Slam-dependent surface lipoprotein n=1 Tax=uncultured Acinetobacter sp. TaxID=165433 RepID=UPI00258F0DC7|nr:Slam-dependent surface lipoprotein [uncultured Acinetobacter sp.]